MVPFLRELSDLFYRCADEEWVPERFRYEIEQLEKAIAERETIEYNAEAHEGNDGSAMLSMCAIAKFSYEYWYRVLPDNPDDQGRNIFGKIWRAIKIGASDAYGFVAEGWIDKDGNGTNETWNSGEAVKAAGARSDAVRNAD